jgi:hypothetical protein
MLQQTKVPLDYLECLFQGHCWICMRTSVHKEEGSPFSLLARALSTLKYICPEQTGCLSYQNQKERQHTVSDEGLSWDPPPLHIHQPFQCFWLLICYVSLPVKEGTFFLCVFFSSSLFLCITHLQTTKICTCSHKAFFNFWHDSDL